MSDRRGLLHVFGVTTPDTFDALCDLLCYVLGGLPTDYEECLDGTECVFNPVFSGRHLKADIHAFLAKHELGYIYTWEDPGHVGHKTFFTPWFGEARDYPVVEGILHLSFDQAFDPDELEKAKKAQDLQWSCYRDPMPLILAKSSHEKLDAIRRHASLAPFGPRGETIEPAT